LRLLKLKNLIPNKRIFDKMNRNLALFLVCIFAVVIRIPRVPHMLGGDGALLVVESTSLLQGNILPWLIHPLSIFGMYSFSGYPLGSVSVMAGLIQLTGENLEVATFLFTALFSLIGVFTSYKLIAYVLDDKRLHWVGAAFYTFLPIIYDFTYNTSSSRGPFFALSPLVILLLLKSTNESTPKRITEAILYSIIAMLFHRMGFVLLAFVTVTIIFNLIKKLLLKKERNLNQILKVNRLLCVLFAIGSFAIFAMSIVLLGLNPKTALPDEFYIGAITLVDQSWIGIGIDYFLFYSIELTLSIIGIFFVLRKLWNSDVVLDKTNSKFMLLLFLTLPLFFFLGTPAYTRHLLAPFIVIFSIIGLSNLQEKKKPLKFFFLFNIVAFGSFIALYSILWRDILFHATISTVGCILIATLVIVEDRQLRLGNRTLNNPVTSQHIAILLVTFIMLSAYVNRDMRILTNVGDISFPAYVSDEEVTVAEYIREELMMYNEPHITLFSHIHLAFRISAYARTDFLTNPHGTQLVITDFVTTRDALYNSTLYWQTNLLDLHLYEHDTRPKSVWTTIMRSDYDSMETQGLLEDLNIRFFVALKGTNSVEYSIPFESLFRQTISAPIVFETEHILVYQLA